MNHTLLVEVLERGQGLFVGQDLDAVAIGFFFIGFEGLEPAVFSIDIAPFHTCGHGFQGTDIFVLAPVLPVSASWKLLGVVVDG